MYFIVAFKYYLCIVNAPSDIFLWKSLWVIFMGIVAKQCPTVPIISAIGFSSEIFV